MSVRCRVCGGDDAQLLGSCRPFSLAHTIPGGEGVHRSGELYRCRRCFAGFREPCLSREELDCVYENMPQEGMKDYDASLNVAWNQALETLRGIGKGLPLSVLDVGCNLGIFLDQLPEPCKRYGVEPSKLGQEACRQKGISVIAAGVDDIPSEWNDAFDVVTLFDVFEHLHTPAVAMNRAMDCLKVGGSLLLSTANMDAWAWKWEGLHHTYLDTPLHITFGSPDFFEWYCAHGERKVGLEAMTKISHQVGGPNKMDDVLANFYWGCLVRGGLWRIPQRAMHLVPRLRSNKHRRNPPGTAFLKDHLFVHILKKEDNAS